MNIFSYFTIKSVLDFMEVLEREQMRGNMGYAWRLKYLHSLGIFNVSLFRPYVEQMLINVTLQYMEIRFAHGLHVDALIFQTELDILLSEVNAYIPHFTTNHSISPK
jgi:accessory gene regulator protein AgrB